MPGVYCIYFLPWNGHIFLEGKWKKWKSGKLFVSYFHLAEASHDTELAYKSVRAHMLLSVK